MTGAIAAMLLACCRAHVVLPPRGEVPPALLAASPGADTATSPATLPPAAGAGSPGGDSAPMGSTPGAGTVTGSPGGDSAPAGESPGGSTRPSNTSR